MADPLDPFGGLEGADRDAFAAIQNMLRAYGLESLSSAVVGFIQQGYDANTIGLLLQETPEYKQRFSANEARKKKGLPVLAPAEYLSVERSYREVMSAAGLPIGFYDSPDDFTKWIENDVSPTEVKQRVDVAAELVNNIDPAVKQQFEQWYSTGDMIAYALDRSRATQVLERQARAAEIGAAATTAGVGVGRDTAELIAQEGFTAQQSRAGFSQVAQDSQRASILGSVYGENFGEEDLVKDVFLNDAEAQQKRTRLASQERANFSGSSGVSRSSLSRSTSGQF